MNAKLQQLKPASVNYDFLELIFYFALLVLKIVYMRHISIFTDSLELVHYVQLAYIILAIFYIMLFLSMFLQFHHCTALIVFDDNIVLKLFVLPLSMGIIFDTLSIIVILHKLYQYYYASIQTNIILGLAHGHSACSLSSQFDLNTSYMSYRVNYHLVFLHNLF